MSRKCAARHTSGVGQEAVPVGFCAATAPERLRFWHIPESRDLPRQRRRPEAMMAELYGKATGVARGKCGSMQLNAPEVGFLCASALVGGTVPKR